MKLILKCESDEVIDVPDEAIIEETLPGDDITSTLSQIDDALLSVDNLLHAVDNLKKFGITKEFLHLVNTDNQLGKALNITLPYYENDDSEIDLEEKEMPDVEVIAESVGETIKKWYDKIVELINKAIEWFINFFGLYKVKAKRNIKMLQQLQKSVTENKTNLDHDKIGDTKMTGPYYDQTKAIFEHIQKEWTKLRGYSRGDLLNVISKNRTPFIKDPNDLQKVLVVFNFVLKLDEKTKLFSIEKFTDGEHPDALKIEENSTLSELGWAYENIVESFKFTIAGLEVAIKDSDIKKQVNIMKFFNDLAKKVQEEQKRKTGQNINFYSSQEHYKAIQNSLKVYKDSVSILSKGLAHLSVYVIRIGTKVPLNEIAGGTDPNQKLLA